MIPIFFIESWCAPGLSARVVMLRRVCVGKQSGSISVHQHLSATKGSRFFRAKSGGNKGKWAVCGHSPGAGGGAAGVAADFPNVCGDFLTVSGDSLTVGGDFLNVTPAVQSG